MNEKLLEQRAEEYAENIKFTFETDLVQKIVRMFVKNAIVDFTEQETKLLSEHILELQKDKGRLIDENKKELQEQNKHLYNDLTCTTAGLHEGQPKWHDLRKDPNDLPKLNKTDMSDYVITDRGVSYYNGRLKSWYIQNDYRLSDKVIAWCEIPTFNTEE